MISGGRGSSRPPPRAESYRWVFFSYHSDHFCDITDQISGPKFFFSFSIWKKLSRRPSNLVDIIVPLESPRRDASNAPPFGGTKCARGRSYERLSVDFCDFFLTPSPEKPVLLKKSCVDPQTVDVGRRGTGWAIQRCIVVPSAFINKKPVGQATAEKCTF